MTEYELNQHLKKYSMTLKDACGAVFLLTGAVLDPDNIKKHAERQGRLSGPLSATFGLLFVIKGNIKL